MIKKTYNFVLRNEFLRSSAIVFASSLSVGVLNYLLVIYASRALGEDYSTWTALSGIVAILATFNTGLFTEINKTFASFSKESPTKALEFYDFLMLKARTFLFIGIIGAPLLGLILQIIFHTGTTPILAVLAVGVFLGIYTGLNRFLLLGMLHNLKFGIVNLTTGLARFIPTVILFNMGIKIWALPIGLLTSQIIAYFVAVYYIHKIKKKVSPSKTKHKFYLKPYLIASLKSTFILFLLATILNIAPVISESNLSNQSRDLFAVMFNFGQIIHFGSVAFTQAIVVHASRNKNNKIYFFSIMLMGVLTSLIAGIFFFFGDFMLGLFGRSGYIDKVSLILYYSVFIALYNIVFISVQYLLSHSKYKVLIFSLPILCIGLIISMYSAASLSDSVHNYITAQIIVASVAALFYFVYISSDNLKNIINKEKILQ